MLALLLVGAMFAYAVWLEPTIKNLIVFSSIYAMVVVSSILTERTKSRV